MIAILVVLMSCGPKPVVVHHPLIHGDGDGLWAQLITDTPFRSRIESHGEPDLIIFYGGEEQGSMGVCGCSSRPRGSLARIASFIDATETANPDAEILMVNGGHWLDDATSLDGTPRLDAPIINQWMIAGLEQLGVDALNVGYNDMAGINSLSGQTSELPMVSANLIGTGVQRFITVDVNNVSIGITGISSPGVSFINTPGFTANNPEESGLKTLQDLHSRVDIVVLLAFQAPETAKSLAATGLVDIVIDTNSHNAFYPPFRQDNAIWVRSHKHSMRLGELRLTLDEGAITSAIDRKIDMDADIPQRTDLMRLQESARQEIEIIEQRLFGL